MKESEKLFERGCGNYDHKHINNTSNRPMPTELIEQINEGNVTIEMLDEFKKRGYDIYKYATQLTIHGTFDAALQRRVNGYVCMNVNQNGSLGVRWIAIDAEKKRKIFGYLREVGWSSESNSTEHYAYKLKQVTSKNDPAIAEFKAEAERINKDLFIGSCYVCLVRDLFRVFVQLRLVINAVYDEQVIPIIEDVSGKTMQELDQMRQERIAKIKADREKYEKEYAEKRKQRDAEIAKKVSELNVIKEQRITELLADGYTQGDYAKLKKGDTLRTVVVGMEYTYSEIELRDIEWSVTMVRSGKVRIEAPKHFARWLPEKQVFYVKQQEPQLPSGNYQLIEYSEKAIALTGDTKAIKDRLVKLGGRYNPKLTCGAGWIFPKSKEVELKKVIGL